MLTCKDTSRLISEGLDRNLSLRERMGLHLHLWMCDNCRHFKQQMDFLRQALHRGWVSGDLPSDRPLPREAQERIRHALEEHRDPSGD